MGWRLCPAGTAASGRRLGRMRAGHRGVSVRSWRSRVVKGAASDRCTWGPRSGPPSLTIQQLNEEELGAAAVEYMAPEPIGVVSRRGAGVGRGATRRLAGVEIPGHELGATVVHLGTLGAVADVEVNVGHRCSGSAPSRAQERCWQRASVARSPIWPGTGGVPATRRAGESLARPLSAAAVIGVEANAGKHGAAAIVKQNSRDAADLRARTVRQPSGSLSALHWPGARWSIFSNPKRSQG